MVEPLDLDSLPQSLQEALRPRVERLGYLGDFFRYSAHQPDALAHFHAFTEALKSALPPELTEVVALTVASRKGNDYERNQHQRLAHSLGFPTDWILGLCGDADEPASLDPGQQAVRRLAIAMVDERSDAMGAALDSVTRIWGQQIAVGVVLLCARFLAHAAASAAFGLAPPVPPLLADGAPHVYADPAKDSPVAVTPVPSAEPAAENAINPAEIFVPVHETPSDQLDLWPSIVIPGEAIDAEVERLAALPRPADGRRRSLIKHPNSTGPGPGLAAGIRVTLEVLLPGEETAPIRHNSSQAVFSIRGGGTVAIDGHKRAFSEYDVWNTPSMSTYVHINDTPDIQVRLLYSNAALLEKLNVHYVDPNPPEAHPETEAGGEQLAAEATPFEQLFKVAEDDEEFWLMSYERLVNPPMQESPALMWPWRRVKTELDRLHTLGPAYRGRRLYLLYNPATGRTNGTTHSFFATMTIRPAGIVDRPHRHTAAAINYFFQGSGHSVVGGKVYHWKAGDLMLSAPGWQVHNHASGDADVYELTIQDSPLHLSMDSLLWQEDLKRSPILIGSHSGWQTNRDVVS